MNRKPRTLFSILAFSIIFLSSISNGQASYTTYRVEGELEYRNFFIDRPDHDINDQLNTSANLLFTYNNEEFIRVELHPRIYVDILDQSRNRYLPLDAYLALYQKKFEVSLGLKRLSWGVSDFYNPTDVINRKDLEFNFFEPEKMAELMVHTKSQWGSLGPLKNINFEIAILPLFLKTPLPELDTRYRLAGTANGLNYELDDYQQLPNGFDRVGIGASLKATISPVDIQLNYFHGPERLPGYFLNIDSSGSLRLRPFYYTIDMIGLNSEAAIGEFNFHLEAAYTYTGSNSRVPHDINFESNNALPSSYWTVVPGIRWQKNIFDSQEIILALEYYLEQSPSSTLRDFRPFQNDLFFGIQYLSHNRLDTQAKLGVIKDLSHKETGIFVDVSTKTYKDLEVFAGALFLVQDSSQTNSPISYFKNNSQAKIGLRYSFGGDSRTKMSNTTLEDIPEPPPGTKETP